MHTKYIILTSGIISNFILLSKNLISVYWLEMQELLYNLLFKVHVNIWKVLSICK